MSQIIDENGDIHCTHPEVRLGKDIYMSWVEDEILDDKFYCLACGERIDK